MRDMILSAYAVRRSPEVWSKELAKLAKFGGELGIPSKNEQLLAIANVVMQMWGVEGQSRKAISEAIEDGSAAGVQAALQDFASGLRELARLSEAASDAVSDVAADFAPDLSS